MGSDKNKYLFYSLLILLLSLSTFLHFWQLGSIPEGFFIDEASIGYNAYCIAETGADEYGNTLPILFRCFDNYHDTVMVYTLAPLIKIFGLNIWITRSPSALYMILAGIAFYFLAFFFSRKKWLSLIGAFTFSLLPWSFAVSRSIMSGYTPMLLGMILGSYFLIKAIGRKSYKYAVLAAFFWAFAMYSHNCGRPMTAVDLVLFVLALNVILIKRWKVFACFCAAYLGFMLPMIIYVLMVPQSMTSRFNDISVWGDIPEIMTLIHRILLRYSDYFNPVFLFWKGDLLLRHNTGGGELFIFMAPLIITGIYVSIRKFKRNPYYRFMLLCLVFYPLAAILTEDRMHSTRSINGLPFWGIMAIIGAAFLWKLRIKQKAVTWIVVLLLIGICFELSFYMYDYMGDYKERSKCSFFSNYSNALKFSCDELQKGETLYISGFFFPYIVNQNFKPHWYAMILFFRNIPPAIYQKQGIPTDMVTPFYGQPISNSGILLTSNYQIRGKTKDGKFLLQRNSEKLPTNSVLLKNIQVTQWQVIQVYRIKGN